MFFNRQRDGEKRANQIRERLWWKICALVARSRCVSVTSSSRVCRQVAQRVAGGGDGVTALRGLRLDVLRVVCSHEHYVSLNLQFSSLPPVSPPSPTPSVASTTSGASVGGGGGGSGGGGRPVSWRLTDEYRTRHFLSALLLSELALDAYSPLVLSMRAHACTHARTHAVRAMRPRPQDCALKSDQKLLLHIFFYINFFSVFFPMFVSSAFLYVIILTLFFRHFF